MAQSAISIVGSVLLFLAHVAEHAKCIGRYDQRHGKNSYMADHVGPIDFAMAAMHAPSSQASIDYKAGSIGYQVRLCYHRGEHGDIPFR
jgi:hypothetical protein